jgi:hypothetical protein
MEKTDFPWLVELGLKKDILKDTPEGEKPLSWAFKSGVLKESAYTLWASNHYKHPHIKEEFFSLAFDTSLFEKFSKIYTWNETCYPIYFWENTLFIACLEPIEISSEYKICFVISSYSAMTSAWNKHFNSGISLHQVDNHSMEFNFTMEVIQPSHDEKMSSQYTEIPPSLNDKNTNTQESTTSGQNFDFDFNQMDTKKDSSEVNKKLDKSLDINKQAVEVASALPPIPKHVKSDQENQSESLDALDFSAISSTTHVEEQTQSTMSQNDNQTQTSSGISFNDSTSATALKISNIDNDRQSLNNLDLPDMSFAKEEIQKSNIKHSTEENEAASLSEYSQSSFNKANSDTWTEESQIHGKLDDDYTPLPFLTKSEQDKSKKSKITPNEQTLTDHARPAHIPSKNLISETELNNNLNLSIENGRKGIIAHIFQLLKRDYRELMWVEGLEESQFYPQYCYGAWDIQEIAWKTPVNISQPNIFKIAYTSGLAFHGEISDNPFNDQYYELWHRNQKPDWATIYPICYDDYCYGFIVGFSKGPDFDETKSLKKVENLVSICKNSFLSVQVKKAS